MTARSGESPTPCEVSGPGGVGSGLFYLFLFSGETAGDGVGEEVLCRGRGSEGESWWVAPACRRDCSQRVPRTRGDKLEVPTAGG